MFLFGKKKLYVQITDIVFMKTAAKWQGCIDAYNKNASLIFIAWFEETLQQLQKFLSEQNVTPQVVLYRQATNHITANKDLIFIEHYPLSEKETALFTSLNLEAVKIFSSLDEPLFQMFGGDNMINMMQNAGVKEYESLQHPLITKALKNAQDKIAAKVTIEQNALSQSDWFKRNLKM
ncbi:hypothetical protein BH11BAC6_BH11BAC6_00170 [soil metagenome]